MACTNHPLVTRSVERCARCALPFCPDCLLDLQGRTVCASCKAGALAAAASAGDGSLQDPQPAPPEGERPPWERASDLGWWSAYWGTVAAVMTRPSVFFQGMEKRTASWSWLAIPAVNYTLSTIMSIPVYALGFGPFVRWIGSVNPEAARALEPIQGSIVSMVGTSAIVAPAVGAVYAIVLAGTIHAWLRVFKQNRLPFAQTARGVCYAYSPYVLTLLPVLGHIVAPFWTAWAMIRMVQRMHGTGLFTAFLSVFWIVILCVCCCILPYVSLVGFALSQGR